MQIRSLLAAALIYAVETFRIATGEIITFQITVSTHVETAGLFGVQIACGQLKVMVPQSALSGSQPAVDAPTTDPALPGQAKFRNVEVKRKLALARTFAMRLRRISNDKAVGIFRMFKIIVDTFFLH